MKVTILQFDNRPEARQAPLGHLLLRNRAYAERHGYQHVFLSQIDADLPVYWLKPHFIRQALADGADMVVWIDTDAVVHDLDRRIEDLVEGGVTMVAAGDNPLWGSPFNAGVMIVTAHGGIDLMDRWLALFAGTAWRRTETAWVCDDEWAGPSYEQGALVRHLLPDLIAAGQLRLIDWRILQSPFPVEGSFTLHFAGAFKPNIPVYLATLKSRP